ncbi:uncharacterized membrane-anchored protein YjiN (DUF445 family) [Chitinivorax tropicus]|uniref:Uncharacterized membrane-anchored protein YjiN (DUF445 family) n=1 Tax=Chitinivorax tropicus TaxID=714531 RepID=A0A840MH30_9PROT|nr:hypothetical protein [Chitinivorax tropicus]MBB5016835.1 uncharacterized membrane-anchored protein YjiN (DUF445 family) [Chitinivorax tropicus]
MTTPISSVGNLAAIVSIIRKQLVEDQSRQRTRRATNSSPPQALSRSIEQRVSSSLAAVTHDDPDRKHKGIKAFIEAVLLNELGDQLLNDPAFYQMADTITRQILASPALSDAVTTVVAHLTTDAGSPNHRV